MFVTFIAVNKSELVYLFRIFGKVAVHLDASLNLIQFALCNVYIYKNLICDATIV
jgi:hypothetical protein